MGIRDFIKSLGQSSDSSLIDWKVDPSEGIDFMLDRKILSAPEQHAIDNPFFGFQLAYLKGLVEQDRAVKNANGFTIHSSVAVELGEDFIALFDFPCLFPGKYSAKIEGNTAQASFSVSVLLQMLDGATIPVYSLHGPFLKVAENEIYSLTSADWQGLKALADHKVLGATERGEYENNWLIFQLQIAHKAGMPIDLAHFNRLDIISPESVGVSMEELANGDIILTPSFGSGVKIADIQARLGQVSGDKSHCILRVKDKFVLLDEKRLEATREILTSRRIPKEQVSNFLKSPTAYLDASLIDLDTGFSLRVHGAERFAHRYFGDVEKSGIDWFSKKCGTIESPELLSEVIDNDERLVEVEVMIQDAIKTGAEVVELDDRVFDISDNDKVEKSLNAVREAIQNGVHPREVPSSDVDDDRDEELKTDRAVVAIDSNDEDVEFSKDSRVTGLEYSKQIFCRDNLKRPPFPHQEEGICWMLAHLDLIDGSGEPSGALLADDMGLGKTYMALVAIAEWYRRCKDSGVNQKPTLIVAPLSLIENWQAEVDATFAKSPFVDLVVLQSAGELSQYRIKGGGRETQQEFSDSDLIDDQEQIRYSLKVGKVYGSDRLDIPCRMVLTTYQTLRDYQFSLSRVDWGVVVFDETQNIKNPNALATRAAKGLKADLKLLATGTPVENTLKDFWCLMDTAAPGLLGAWQVFRQEYIAPITSAEGTEVGQIKVDIGRKLRAKVGDYMLRRTKAEKLTGLPEKRIYSGDEADLNSHFSPPLAAVMSGPQLAYYDEIIAGVKNNKTEDKRSFILPSLRRLKVSSIHHDIDYRVAMPKTAKELIRQADASSKIKSMLSILAEIEKRKEKVLIFAETKAVQAYVSALVTTLYKIPVEIINGETKAVATKASSDTRKAIIDRFQTAPGFGVIVMSPVAAGVGLTVVGANNVIHLERHWNPAKEAQATDRVYRIGQVRDVNVYLPMALHPNLRSFDLQLNSLLANKVDLSDAVVAAESIEASDLADCF